MSTHDSMYRDPSAYCARCYRNWQARLKGVVLEVFCPGCGFVQAAYSPHQALSLPVSLRVWLKRLLERSVASGAATDTPASAYQWLDIAGDTERYEG